jgi:hypothetical protein
MSKTAKSSRIPADVRASTRRFEAEVMAAQARRRRRVIAALCTVVVLASGAAGALVARGGVTWSWEAASNDESVRPVDVQFAQVLDPDQGASDADPTDSPTAVGMRIASVGTGDVAFARVYEESLRHAPETDPLQLDDPAAGRLDRVRFPALDSLGRAAPNPPPWQRYAVAMADLGDRPMIAIVIDDLGLNRGRAHKTIALPAPLTLAFMTYAEGLHDMAAAAHDAGHELMLHVPMQPRGRSYDPGPNVLDTNLPAAEIVRRLQWGLGRFDGFVGINNHMGSRFTSSPEGMSYVMRELRARGLLFLDSLTAASSVGAQAARQAGVPFAERDVFIDNAPNDAQAIRTQLAKLEAVAKRRGYAVGIGHPHKETLRVLAEWLPEARRRGFALVPISAIVRHRIGITQAALKPAE